MQDQNHYHPDEKQLRFKLSDLLWILLLVAILFTGAYFRTLGMDWDDGEYLHPDERFLTFVVSAIHPNEEGISFFDSEHSTMNPENVGYTFYVYGTLPLFANRMVSEWLVEKGLDMQWLNRSTTGWDMYLVGRHLSAIYDMITVFLTFLIGLRLFKKIWPAVLATGFYAFAVLPIQLSHYFTVDIMANMLSMAAFYFAVLIMTRKPREHADHGEEEEQLLPHPLLSDWDGVIWYVLFGISFGLSMACKISVLPVASLVVLAGIVQYFNHEAKDSRRILVILRNLVIAGIISFLAFRVGQPYAFNGPGFFNLIPSKEWISDLQSLSGQSNGLVDSPPELQWSRRPIWFGFQNLTIWGVGLPLGIAAWLSFLWMTFELARGRWKDHLVIWMLTFMFFAWQSLNFTSSMRYYMQIYVPLCLIAAWGGMRLWDWLKTKKRGWVVIPILLILFVFASTLGYGYAFSRIYSHPATRVEASDWYFQNIPAPVNVKINTDQGEMQQLFGYEAGQTITQQDPAVVAFTAQKSATISMVEFAHVRQDFVDSTSDTGLTVEISADPEGIELVGYGELFTSFGWDNSQFGTAQTVMLIEPAPLIEGKTYYLRVKPISQEVYLRLTGVVSLQMTTWNKWEIGKQILPEFVESISTTAPKTYILYPKWTGSIDRIEIPHIVDLTGNESTKQLTLRISDINNLSRSTTVTLSGSFAAETDIRGEAYIFELPEPFPVKEGESARIEFLLEGESGVAFFGTKQANESSWDDVVPLRRSGYDPFGELNGEYRSELNFEMYWGDNEEKRERFLSIIEQADIIMITSSRQWGTTTRVPERYPMTTMYYRELIGCPPEEDIFWCYAVAEPGMFEGNLGFQLKEIFQSNPNIGNFEINDQFAEEAFKVYDHPKVLVFEKTADYDRDLVRELFYGVDLGSVIHMVPADVPLNPRNLMLPDARWNQQKDQGTWSVLYNLENWINQSDLVAVVVFYLAITVLGLIVYSITRIVFSGLKNRGYAVSRIFGLLLFAWLCWMVGSAGISLTRGTVWLVVLALVLINVMIFLRNKTAIVEEIKENWRSILIIEAVGLAFFLLFLLIRIGNPDLWHPYKGGEKPMDFSYLNAVLKSTTFPPYDPWFAGGYINYYYYGFVIVGMPVKALGIEPAVAYNLILPLLFSLFALAAFTIGSTLFGVIVKQKEEQPDHSFIGGIATALLALVIGNFGTVEMYFQGLVRLGQGALQDGGSNLAAFFKGIQLHAAGEVMSYYPGDWYWIPSRMLPEEPITEFPFFTFLYADLHAHMIAMPITLLIIAWCVSILINRLRWDNKFSWKNKVLVLFSGALIVGALRPTNTWDFPVFLVLAALALTFVLFNNVKYKFQQRFFVQHTRAVTSIVHILIVVAFLLTALLFYSPFSYWYGEGYTEISLWKGSVSPLGDYLGHWGIMLTIIVIWFATDTYQILKETPVSALKKLRKFEPFIVIGLALFAVILISLALAGVKIHWVAIPLAVWAALLLLQKNIPSVKRFVYFLMGTAMFLTIIVEVIVLSGDIGRMNTVFKFYLQAWNLLAIVAGLGLSVFIYHLLNERSTPFKVSATVILAAVLFCGLLFPVIATRDKISDRMASEAPIGLDGMVYMDYADFNDQGDVYSLDEDAEAIRWMQQNVEGTPVIMEGNTPEYRWGTRFTIYTGLPSVVGWNWHQRQQRAYLENNSVQNRVDQVTEFYSTTDIDTAKMLLERYDVEYIIVGQLEEVYYPEEGLMKFAQYEGKLWKLVFSNTGTTIYQVMDWE